MSLSAFNNAVENIPYWDEISNLYEYNMGEHFTTKDPFYQKFPTKDPAKLKPHEKMTFTEKRRKPPPYITEKQRKLWKQVMKRAWYHDRNLCGCMPIDLGCGMISFVSIFPLIGSIIAYKMHYKLIKACHQAGAPASLQAEMVANIGLDFMMTLVPLLGVLLSWMKASSTRNAALFDTWLREQSNEQHAKRMAAARQQTAVPVPQRGEVRPQPQTQPQTRAQPPNQTRSKNLPTPQVQPQTQPKTQPKPQPPNQARTAPHNAYPPRSTHQPVARKPVPSHQPPPQSAITPPPRAATSQARVNNYTPLTGPPLPPKLPVNSSCPPYTSQVSYPEPPQPAANLGKPPPVPKKLFYPPPAGMYP